MSDKKKPTLSVVAHDGKLDTIPTAGITNTLLEGCQYMADVIQEEVDDNLPLTSRTNTLIVITVQEDGFKSYMFGDAVDVVKAVGVLSIMSNELCNT